MDLGCEGDFWVHQDCINERFHPDWIKQKNLPWIKLSPTCFETVFASDIEPRSRRAWLPYFTKRGTGAIFIEDSIVNLVKKARNKEFTFPQNIDLLTGGFPCQDFSVSGKRLGFNSRICHTGNIFDAEINSSRETRGMLYYWMKEAIELTLPKVFIAENVKGLVSLSKVKDKIEEDFQSLGGGGYLITSTVLFAPDYGVPQKRERVFFIGLRKNCLQDIFIDEVNKNPHFLIQKIFPEPTHTHDKNEDFLNNGLKPYSTVRAILSGLEEPTAEMSDLSQQKYSKAQYLSKGQGQIEIALDGLSPTIRSEHHGNIEYRRLIREYGGKYEEELNNGMEMRRLTVRECARLQTFPDDYEFVRERKSAGDNYSLSASSAYKLIGNAVPPLLAYHIAKNLERIWNQVFHTDC
ncbi:MAG: Modification methylase BspRI [Chroococcopsis gigantea SAG 12.99]|nr:Modification methylase BspRI [Chroococcopsis gigantea SAG 12.99]